MDDKIKDYAIEYIKMQRDAQRPDIKDVVRVINGLFVDLRQDGVIYRQDLVGPEVWTWVDTDLEKRGLSKVYSIGKSALAGAEGYPLITITQSVAPRLDSNVTISALVVGNNDREISRSLAIAVANHSGAYAGIRTTINAIANTGNPGAGVDAASEILSRLNENGLRQELDTFVSKKFHEKDEMN